QSVRQKWNVRLFIVHLDRAVDKSKLRDDPQYYGRQDDRCSSDSDCRPWEVCRKVHGYSSKAGRLSENDPNDNWRSGEFCMPQRNDAGRFGPIETYSKLACASGGGYMYLKSPTDLTSALKWMPLTMNGLWEATVTSQALRRGNYTSGAGVRIGGSLEVTVDGRTRPGTMSIDARAKQGTAPEQGDNRGTVFTAGPD
ncbi:MAG: hypothetical protein ABEL76_14365, partial [Bradymonadaceae bacterium]